MVTTTGLTSILTTTLFITTSTATPQGGNIFGPIEGLSQCAQTIIFDNLNESRCNIGFFPCICDELIARRVGPQISATCTPDESRQYEQFLASICPSNRRPENVTTPIVNTTTVRSTIPVSTSVPVSTRVPISTGVPVSTGISNTTTSAGPFQNTTTAAGGVTTQILVPTTAANGVPTTVTQETVVPVIPTQEGPGGPAFTGAAAIMEVPEFIQSFGGMRAVAMAGGIGLMGLVFAEL
ncbi:hypothetical protein P154DRAFT_576801 [Amniculicola lignicola CBS 123094]|uniref:CFEM domain-containing protein n=1 Tax=Amniculicola lignicola CBS 123094 TaxID=1392246 RepID=A0A6A5WFR2_9PLEO|nr:hypothetical protein P154DRAFT_576801 [Amniculicola lignicola CBS 123094]